MCCSVHATWRYGELHALPYEVNHSGVYVDLLHFFFFSCIGSSVSRVHVSVIVKLSEGNRDEMELCPVKAVQQYQDKAYILITATFSSLWDLFRRGLARMLLPFELHLTSIAHIGQPQEDCKAAQITHCTRSAVLVPFCFSKTLQTRK